MLKKILVVLSILLLVSCGDKKKEIVIEEYICPIKDVFLFDELDYKLAQRVKKANGYKDFSNYQFKMLYKDVYDQELVDIWGNVIDLKEYDNFILEVLSSTCLHCKKSIEDNLDNLLALDTTIIQYFNVGDKDDIKSLYKDIGIDIPNIVIIEKDEDLNKYLKDYLCIDRYPTLISFKDDKVSFNSIGDMNLETTNSYYDLSFNNVIDEKIVDELIKLDRDIDDLKNNLSSINQNKIIELDNDEYTIEASYKLMGNVVDFDDMSNDRNTVYLSEVDDYSKYKDKDLVLLFTSLKDSNDTDKVDFINKLIESNSDVEYIVVLIEGIDNSSNIYKTMKTRFKCEAVSVLGYIPVDFFTIGLINYPSAFFIRKGIYTGVYSNIESVELFNKAIDTFLGDGSIALVKNN